MKTTKKHPLDKPILRWIFFGTVFNHRINHLLNEMERANREINIVLADMQKKDPKVKIEKLRNALSNLVRINELHNEKILKIIQRPVDWKDEYLDEARAVLEETK